MVMVLLTTINIEQFNCIFNERDLGLAHFFMHSTLVIFNPNNHNAIMNNFVFK